MKVIYIINARLPNKKAYGIQIAKMCEAFIEAGVDLELVVPRTRASSKASLKDFFRLRTDVPTTILRGLDWYDRGRAAFFIGSAAFTLSVLWYLWNKKRHRQVDIVYTVDMDTFSFAFLALVGIPVVAEMHDTKPNTPMNRFFFRRVFLVIATNTEIKRSLQIIFHIPDERFLIASNGVDFQLFSEASTRDEARKRLGISGDKKAALYVGRFYEWKGLEILADAAALAPVVDWYVVGDTPEVFSKVTERAALPSNLHIAGECASTEVPLWLAAADVLLVLGTKKNEQSYRHTTPMKVYEYMAARRPIVASKTPALTSIVPQHDAIWYDPDDAHSLAQATEKALLDPDQEALDRNATSANIHSWAARAERINSRLIEILIERKS